MNKEIDILKIIEKMNEEEIKRQKMISEQIKRGCNKCSQWDDYYGCTKCEYL